MFSKLQRIKPLDEKLNEVKRKLSNREKKKTKAKAEINRNRI